MKTRDERNREIERRRTAWQGVKAIQYIEDSDHRPGAPSWAYGDCRWCAGQGCLGCDAERARVVAKSGEYY